MAILRAVRAAVTIPVAVKLSPFFTAPGHLVRRLEAAGADGLVLFNRFYQPDIDLAALRLQRDVQLSTKAEIRLPLLWIGILAGKLHASLAASHRRRDGRGGGQVPAGRRRRGDDHLGAAAPRAGAYAACCSTGCAPGWMRAASAPPRSAAG